MCNVPSAEAAAWTLLRKHDSMNANQMKIITEHTHALLLMISDVHMEVMFEDVMPLTDN
eukprot:CAMPEP_0114501176 /NCGR_PEP_ID=MMETSP0109-20121206/8359_1 /TAXON_ID=29199 /ORGANISM="Chlorarachnion reptans, Strain CCCM449" /LENGTH=58 /DNA_ID=CAMNT_0001678889 /DNA_START=157 /DNA_END=333 /DNA_ORIENTATION=+